MLYRDATYYDNQRRGEVDFVIEYGDKLMPIEVKSGKDYQKHTALANMMKDYPESLYDAVVLCHGNVEEDGNISYDSIYMIRFIMPVENNINI